MIVGHQKIINFLEKSLEKNAISHAYLFFGKEHLGKFSVALDFAEKLSGQKNEKINPNIVIVRPDIEEKKGIIRKKDIGVEKIRELEHELSLSGYEGGYKVAIIDEADRLTLGAQNALLKTLEEPEDKCVIILVAHNAERILATIKSRCVSKAFGLVEEKEINWILPEGKNKKDILFWSVGRPGLAVLMDKNEEELSKKIEIKNELKKILQNDLNDNFALAETLAKNSPELLSRLDIWAAILRQNILGVSPGASTGSREKSLFMIEEMEKAGALVRETNSNPRIILENLFLHLK